MSSSRPCPQCGSSLGPDAPNGLCPQCLVRQGIEILAAEQRPAEAKATRVVAETAVTDSSPTGSPRPRFGDYELLEELAHGGMGVVYRALQISLNRVVALKMILAGQLATTTEVQRFRTEALAAARLDHPNIVPIYDVGEHEGRHYFTMKLVEGATLAERISNAQGPNPSAEDKATRGAFGIRHSTLAIAKIARAVHFAHQRGILHRDLKPTNILLTSDGEPLLTDFGLAKLSEAPGELTASHAVMGSANYMSPEQASGQARLLTAASDIYSLGAILYEALTCQPPFKGGSFVETLRAVTDAEPVRPSALNSSVDRDLETICLKCLEKNPAHRYASAQALAEDLEHWLAGEPISARPVRTWERTVKWARRKPAMAALAATALLAAAVGVGGVLWQWLEAKAARRFAEQKATAEARQRTLAESTAASLRQHLYAADIHLAQQAFSENNLGLAVELLRKHIPRDGETDLRGFEWRYLWQRARGDELFTLPHEDFVETVVFSRDGKWLATTGRELKVRVWDAASGAPLAVLDGLSAPVERGAVLFSPDNRFLIAGASSNLVVWDTRSWKLAAQLAGASFPIAFAADDRTLTARSGRGTISCDTAEWRPTTTESGALGGAGSFRACSLDGRIVATAVAENGGELMRVCDASTQRVLGEIRCQVEQPTSWAVSSDGRWLAAGNWRGEINLWEMPAGREVARWTAHTSPVWSLSFSPDATSLASAGFDQVVHLWAVTNQTRAATLRGHFNEVWSVAFSPDGLRLATGSKDGTAKLWRSESSRREMTLTNALPPLAFLGNSRHLIAAKSERVLAAWDVVSRAELGSLPVFDLGGAEPTTAGRNPDYVAVAILPGLFQLLARRDPPGTRTFVNVGEQGTPVVISPDKHWLARVGRDGIKVVKMDSVRSALLTNAAAPMAFDPNSRRLVTAGTHYTADIWRISTSALQTNQGGAIELVRVATLHGHKWSIAAVGFSPDGNLLVTASTDGTARLWRSQTGESITTLNGHKEGLTCAAFSPDGRTLATGSTDDTVKLWSVATGQELVTLTEFGEDIGALAFSPDGQTLAVGCLPGTGGHQWVQVWRASALATIDAELASLAKTRTRPPSTGNQ